MRGWLAGGLVIALVRVASADDVAPEVERTLAHERAAGFANDPVADLLGEELAVRTRDGFSLDGGLPSEAAVWVDQFVVPGFHRDGRSAFTTEGSAYLKLTSDGDATYGDVSAGLIELESRAGEPGERTIGAASSREAIVAYRREQLNIAARTSLLGFAAPWFVPADRNLVIDDAPNSQDVQIRGRIYSYFHVDIIASAFAARDQITLFTDRAEHPDQRVANLDDRGRATIMARYFSAEWLAIATQSVSAHSHEVERGLAQHAITHELSLDSREYLRRRIANVAGLAKLDWILGAEAHITRHDLDLAGPADDRENVPRAGIMLPAGPSDDLSHVYRGVVWTPDVAGSVGMTAGLSKSVDAYAGVRVDAFGSDVALEPRGSLEVRLDTHQVVRLTAGAYRRAAEQGEELEHTELHPERTSRVALELARPLAWAERGTFYNASLYYADRSHLIVRDQLGDLANTGNGTTYGAYALLGRHRGHWLGQLSVRLEHDDRQDAPRDVVRPFEYSQPVRLEARLVRFVGAWSFGARWELRQGLPSTTVAGSDYDSDRDVYTPHFGALYGDRLPWQHQLDVRIDRTWSRIAVFLDVANVYDHRNTLDWAYNYNFTQRRAVQGPPILPTIGVRGEL